MNLNTVNLKIINSYLFYGLLCLIFSVPIGVYSQHIQLPNNIKKDSVITNKHDISKKTKTIALNGIDGPYIINDTLYNVNSDNKLIKKAQFNTDSLLVCTDNIMPSKFYLSLQSTYDCPKTSYDLPKKMLVISDIEGNYNGFVSFLSSNKIIDADHNWIYNDGHLVLVGDFVDRGKNVTQVLWLIYKLEHQAKKQNGQVHFILGNHEVLNFHGDHRYNRGKYIKVAQKISQFENKKKATQFMYSANSVLGEWLATKNVIEKIGSYIFVHGGLSPEILNYDLSLNKINDLVRTQYKGISAFDDKNIKFLYGSQGPFWYRGLVMKRSNYSKIKQNQLDKLLNYYDAKKIVVGHSPVNNISTAYNGKVIRTDVLHGTAKFSGRTKGLLIENNMEFVIDDLGIKTPLLNEL